MQENQGTNKKTINSSRKFYENKIYYSTKKKGKQSQLMQ